MTICIAALCRFAYPSKPDGTPDTGFAVVTASDRMFTDQGLEIEYETGQGKWAVFGNRTVVMVADSIPVQSEIISQMWDNVDNSNTSPREIAHLYAKALIEYKRSEAEKLYLLPYGFTVDTFMDAMKSSGSTLIHDLAQNVLDHTIHVEAIVAGIGQDGIAQVFHVDGKGTITSHTDVGFVSIGSGHYHANSYLTSHGYWNQWSYYNAVAAVYAAKRQAETAPGVGSLTDMVLITKDTAEPVHPAMQEALKAEYPIYKRSLAKLETKMTERVWNRCSKAFKDTGPSEVPDHWVKDIKASEEKT